MGIAIMSGVLDNLTNPNSNSNLTDESAPSTPLGSMIIEKGTDSVPNKLVLRVKASREEIELINLDLLQLSTE